MTNPERQTVKQGQITFEVVPAYPTEGLPWPEAANWFQFAAAAEELQLSVGYLDPREIADAIAAVPEKREPIKATITRRFFLSTQGFDRLRTAVNQVGELLDQQRGRRSP